MDAKDWINGEIRREMLLLGHAAADLRRKCEALAAAADSLDDDLDEMDRLGEWSRAINDAIAGIRIRRAVIGRLESVRERMPDS